jgi:CRP-like cAMP-binding protein
MILNRYSVSTALCQSISHLTQRTVVWPNVHLRSSDSSNCSAWGAFGLLKKRCTAVTPYNGKPSLIPTPSVQHFALFAGICPADCFAIISLGRGKRLYRRQTLFSVGDSIDQVFLILSGSVKMTQTSFRGGKVILRVCGAGDLVGTLGLWPEGQHDSAAQIAQAGTALVWDSATFSKLLDHFARLRHNTFRVLEKRLQEIEQRFRELSTDDVASRLSSELIRLSERFGFSVKENREIHLSQTDLAQLTGTTVSTVSRLLSRWEQLGVVRVRREVVQVQDLAALAQLSEDE